MANLPTGDGDGTPRKWIVKSGSGNVVVRSGPGSSYKNIGTVMEEDIFEEVGRASGWIKVKLDDEGKVGWLPQSYITRYDESEEDNVSTTEDNTKEEDEKKEYIYADTEDDDEGSGYRPDIKDVFSYATSSVNESIFSNIENAAGIFGLPYQFLPSADVRVDGSTNNAAGVGYEYADHIVTQMPLLLLAPGKCNFMTNYSKKDKQSLLERILQVGSGIADSVMTTDDLELDSGKYYTFEYDSPRYYQFVNPMCRIASIYLGIQDVKIGNTKLSMLNWEDYTRGKLSSIFNFGNYNSVPFYLESETSISESFSNSTTQSMIASAVNSISDMGRELSFLMGSDNIVARGIDALNDSEIMSNIENVQNIISGLLGSNGSFLNNLTKHLTTVATGGKITFPEIWSDSSFSRSYNCEFKFVSPDPSNLSIYLNVLVPLFHLMGMVCPQMLDNNPNGYMAPFIVRAIYKGFFNVDMGIITDMSVTKGGEGQWTVDGLPTTLTISMTIKDLYNAMSITPTTLTNFKYDTMSNTALMDYIANLCGINIYKPEAIRAIEMFFMNDVANRIADIPNNIWGKIGTKFQNMIINNIFR